MLFLQNMASLKWIVSQHNQQRVIFTHVYTHLHVMEKCEYWETIPGMLYYMKILSILEQR